MEESIIPARPAAKAMSSGLKPIILHHMVTDIIRIEAALKSKEL